MRGDDQHTADMFSYFSPEGRVRLDHPLRTIRRMTDEVLKTLSPRFARMYSDIGRASIPPEQLLRVLLLQPLYTIRSERLLMEEIDRFRGRPRRELEERLRAPLPCAAPVKKVYRQGPKPKTPPLFSGAVSFGNLLFLG